MYCNLCATVITHLPGNQCTQARHPPPLLISVLLGRRVNRDLRMWAGEHCDIFSGRAFVIKYPARENEIEFVPALFRF